MGRARSVGWTVEDRGHDTPCWIWDGALNDHGYGSCGRIEDGVYHASAHRWSYAAHVGPIPDGLDLDHLCRVTDCINPDHLEPVTRSVNALRGNTGKHMSDRTHCPQGHERTPENTYRAPSMRTNTCLPCRRERQRQYDKSKKEKECQTG